MGMLTPCDSEAAWKHVFQLVHLGGTRAHQQ